MAYEKINWTETTPLFDTSNINDPDYCNMAHMETQYEKGMESFLPTRADNTRDVRVQVVGSFPSGDSGQIIYHTENESFYVYNGSEWFIIAGKGHSGIEG